MTIIAWLIPALVPVLLLTIVVRRLALRFLRAPHVVVLMIAVLTATVLLLAATSAFAPTEWVPEMGTALVLAGFLAGVLLTAQEFRNPR